MSALKKQTALRWSHRNELSPGGSIVATVWSARVGIYDLEVTNYPGTKSLDWQITISRTLHENLRTTDSADPGKNP